MAYVDGFMAAVSNDQKDAYISFAKRAWGVFKDHGALGMTECWGDDVPEGEVTSFPMAVKCAEGETVVFSWIRWASREARDAGWEAIMADPRMSEETMAQMPFDGKRMIHGGFVPVVDL